MTRRERMEARLERREAWAAARDSRAAAGFSAARRAVDGIPPGLFLAMFEAAGKES